MSSGRDRIRRLLESRVGQVVTSAEIQSAAGIGEYSRRIRELREEEGMQISSYHDRPDLKPGEYVLETLEHLPRLSRRIPPRVRIQVLEEYGATCQLCGSGAGDADPMNPRKRIRIHVAPILPIDQGGTLKPDNLRTLCSNCSRLRSALPSVSESSLALLGRIRRAPRAVQREIYEALKRSFEA